MAVCCACIPSRRSAVDPRLELASVRHEHDGDRIEYVARLAMAWARIGTTPAAIVVGAGLSEYSGARREYGLPVGLDHGALRAAEILRMLHEEELRHRRGGG